jgi:hypothetical protein
VNAKVTLWFVGLQFDQGLTLLSQIPNYLQLAKNPFCPYTTTTKIYWFINSEFGSLGWMANVV